jgi:hypothetical protein
MSGESPKKIGRGYERNLDAGQFQPMIDSWELHLRAEMKSAKTIRTYLEAAQWFAAEYLIPAGFTDWDGVRAKQVQEWTVTLLGRYSDSYANNQFRALQQFFKWHATEDPDEQRPNPMAGLKPPKIGDKLVPVFTDDELAALLGTCKGGGFQNRRDSAVISVFKDTGALPAVARSRPYAGRTAAGVHAAPDSTKRMCLSACSQEGIRLRGRTWNFPWSPTWQARSLRRFRCSTSRNGAHRILPQALTVLPQP